jgi:hypothetical protein
MACRTCDMIRGILMSQGMKEDVADAIAYSAPIRRSEEAVKRKAKRKVSKYQREFGKQMKKLKKKHPRTAVKNLMKRAHRATKRALK